MRRPGGWAKFERHYLDSYLAEMPLDMAAWAHIVAEAAFTHRDFVFGGRRFRLGPGQWVGSERTIAGRVGKTKKWGRGFFTRIERNQLALVERSRTGTIVTILDPRAATGPREPDDSVEEPPSGPPRDHRREPTGTTKREREKERT